VGKESGDSNMLVKLRLLLLGMGSDTWQSSAIGGSHHVFVGNGIANADAEAVMQKPEVDNHLKST
jgi:hypothetical protein